MYRADFDRGLFSSLGQQEPGTNLSLYELTIYLLFNSVVRHYIHDTPEAYPGILFIGEPNIFILFVR